MSATQPPPLPDVPFARLAADPSGPTTAYVLRPVSRVARFFIALPLPVTLLLSVSLLARAYWTGTTFVHDTNYLFVRVVHSVIFAVLSAGALLTAAIALAATWRRLRPGVRTRGAACVIAATVVGVLAINCQGAAFRAGKTRAYAGVNATLLAADCAAMAAGLKAPGNVRESDFVEGTDPTVPAYLRSLRPRYVSVRPDLVEVVMAHDFMSGTDHESFVVPVGPADPTASAYASSWAMVVISKQPPVFRFPVPK
jgi:hypothetical protein